jgi:hypothetical protein
MVAGTCVLSRLMKVPCIVAFTLCRCLTIMHAEWLHLNKQQCIGFVQVLDDYASAALGGRKSTASRISRFASFPPVLVLVLKRYYVAGAGHCAVNN